MAKPRAWSTASVLSNGRLVRLVAAHFLAVVAEYGAVVAVLVYAFEHGGPRTTGFASLAILTPTLLGGPIAAVLTNELRPQSVRRWGLAAQAAGYGVAAASALAGLPVALVVAATVVALGAVSTLRPSGAVLLPSVVHTSLELTTGNLWISYCEGISALAGPLVAAALLSRGGPEAVLSACLTLALGAVLLSTLRTSTGPPPARTGTSTRPGAVLSGALDVVRARPWTAGLLGVALARYTVIGALDVLLVVLAFGELDLGSSGAGVLNALVGAGAVVSAAAATMVVRRRSLAPWLAGALALSAAVCLMLGVWTSVPVAVAVLPTLGLAGALVDSLGRMLLQRSADPSVLGSVFALVEVIGGVGMLVGSGLVQVLIAVGNVHVALIGLAALLLGLLLCTGRSVLRADAGADVPVVEMSLLRELPMFAPLPPVALEAVARTASHQRVSAGDVVVRQGEPGDCFYAVVYGEFEVVMSGELIRTASRGGFFGEVALLADVPRTATVRARGEGELVVVERVPFLVAVTGSDTSRAAAWGVVRSLRLDTEVPPQADVLET